MGDTPEYQDWIHSPAWTRHDDRSREPSTSRVSRRYLTGETLPCSRTKGGNGDVCAEDLGGSHALSAHTPNSINLESKTSFVSFGEKEEITRERLNHHAPSPSPRAPGGAPDGRVQPLYRSPRGCVWYHGRRYPRPVALLPSAKRTRDTCMRQGKQSCKKKTNTAATQKKTNPARSVHRHGGPDPTESGFERRQRRTGKLVDLHTNTYLDFQNLSLPRERSRPPGAGVLQPPCQKSVHRIRRLVVGAVPRRRNLVVESFWPLALYAMSPEGHHPRVLLPIDQGHGDLDSVDHLLERHRHLSIRRQPAAHTMRLSS